MKKILWLMLVMALMTGVASANSIFELCSNFGSSSGPVTDVCPGFSVPGGQSLLGVEVWLQADYSLGNGGPISVTYTFTPASGTWTPPTQNCTVSGSSNSNAWTCGLYSGNQNAPGTTELFDSSADWAGDAASGFNVGVSFVNNNGGTTFTASSGTIVEYDYGVIPEPVTMTLVGGGLLGVGLLAKRRRKKV